MKAGMFTYTVRPVELWPGERTPLYRRERSPLKVTWSRTVETLNRELAMLGAKNITLRLNVTERDINLNGELRANARPKDPGVLVEFDAKRLKGEPHLVYKCDHYLNWQANLLHIALGLEALRKVDRYGITNASEQYHGFKALPASTAPTHTTEWAIKTLEMYATNAGVPPSVIAEIGKSRKATETVARHVKARYHPDSSPYASIEEKHNIWHDINAALEIVWRSMGVTQ